jgi:hypothetical protein
LEAWKGGRLGALNLPAFQPSKNWMGREYVKIRPKAEMLSNITKIAP